MTTPNLFDHIDFTSIDDLPEPTNGPYIVRAKSGYFVHRNFHFGRVLVPLRESPGLPEAEPMLWANPDLGIPTKLIGQAYSFFRSIYEQKSSEAMVDITWSEKRGYRLFVPPQRCTGTSVHATRNLEHYHGQIVGTIHSHCNFGAGHSGTDKHDASGHDGLHITIGDVLKPKPSIAAMITVSGIQWDLDLEELLTEPLEPVPHPKHWERYVSDPIPTKSTIPTTYTQPWWADDHPWDKYPNRNTPVVVSKPRNSPTSSKSLALLTWAFRDMLDDSDRTMLEEAEDAIDVARDILDKLGIDMDVEFHGNPLLFTGNDWNDDYPGAST